MGNMAQAIVNGLIESKVVEPRNIFASNRSPGKLQKAVDNWGINTCTTNEGVIDNCEIVVLAMKPQDLVRAIEPLARLFSPNQIVISLAAGIKMDTLGKYLPNCRLVRVAGNTPALIRKGVIGYFHKDDDEGLSAIIEDLFKPMGTIFKTTEEDHFDALIVGSSAGTGFVFELMSYFNDWIEEHGFPPDESRKMTVSTFLGAAMLAEKQSEYTIDELQSRVVSKKGVTASGLESMRELEIERALRISFEKAALRNQDLAKVN